MAESVVDIPISNLTETTKIGDTDLIVLQQGEDAVKASGATLKSWLYEVSQAHGMIQSISKVSTSGLVDTYRITLADGTTYDFTVTNGKEIKSVTNYFAVSNSGTTAPTSWSTTAKVPTATNKYLWMYTVVAYTNGTSTSTTKHVAGVYGDTGAKGDKGDPPAMSSKEVAYQVSDSGTTIPTGTWSTTIPSVGQGKYLWTRVTTTWETGSPVVSYSIARSGMDGTGAVSSVNGVSPDSAGNVALTKSNIGLGNVPNVSTNDQTPTYTMATALSQLSSGEKLSTAFGKIAKAISEFSGYVKPYGLNAINIDSTSGSWITEVSETGHGTVPKTWVTVMQMSCGNFVTQLAINVENSSTSVRQGNRMWVRNKYINGAWSTWMPFTSLCSASRGSSASLTVTSDKVQITLDTWITGTDNSGFSFSNGGVKVPMDGIVLVSGAAYIYGDAKTETYRGTYLYKNDTNNEISSTWEVGKPYGSVAAPAVLIPVSAGDVIYLYARSKVSITCAPNNAGTHLDIMYV